MAARVAVRRRKAAFLPAGAGPFLRGKAIEAGGIGLIAAAAAILASLASFAVSDPSLNTATSGPVRNLLGWPGAVMSDLLLQALGFAGVLLAPVLTGWGWRLWREHRLARPALRVALLPLAILLSAAGLAAVSPPADWPLESGLGGFAGALVLNHAAEAVYRGGLAFEPAWMAAVLGSLGLALALYLLGLSAAEWTGAGRRAAGGLRRLLTAAAGLRSLRARLEGTLGGSRATAAGRPGRGTGERGQAVAGRAALKRGSGSRVEPTLEDRPGGPRKRDIVAADPRPKTAGSRTAKQPSLDFGAADGTYRLPPLDLLDEHPRSNTGVIDEEALQQNARLLEGVLDDFGVRGEIVKVRPGPVVTLYELEPAPGTKTSRVIGLADDIARSMSAVSVRIATVPGRSVIGIELPNRKREVVYLRELLESSAYEDGSGKLPLVLGKDIGGGPIIVDLARMPHLLIAGTTGSGKSVGLNAMILSLLYRLRPDACKLIMIDPKMLELSIYDDIPHLIAPVVTEPKKAVVALKWTTREMEERYRSMSKLGVRNIEGYNKRLAAAREKGEVLTRKVQTGFDAETGKPVIEEQPLDLTPLPYIVVVVDEMADLMLVAGKEIEGTIQRLAQMARAAGIHLIMATQRPSVDVVTGTIKANFPTRISFQVTSKIDSRTILGEQGAEQLLGQGDMLYMAGGGRIQRVHGPFVHDDEVEAVVQALKSQGEPSYIEAVTDEEDDGAADMFAPGGGSGDDLYDQAVALVAREGKASTSFVQRHLQIGYNRAARIIEQMEKEGVVSAANHVGRREVLVQNHSGMD